MSYKDKPQIKLYKYENSAFVLQAIIDDFQEVSFEHNIYEAGTFTITINYNIPNALLFQRGLFCQFGNNPYDFGEIYSIQDAIGQDGKGSQIRTITGRDARYILKRRVIKNMNSNGLWTMTDKGELCLRNLIKDQCGSSAESKRQLPITNTIPASADAKGKVYSVSENFTNLYEVCKTIATQSEIGWRLAFDGSGLSLEVFEGADLSQTVRFDTNFESLANGEFSDSSESYSNAIYIGGKGQNDDRDIYEGEDGTPEGLDRFESWDNQSSLTVESEYEAEALSMLTQYGQTLTMSGNGLAKCPYVFREQYDIGDTVTVAFSGKSAKAQILSITEHWSWGAYDISFAFGKPQNNLADQLQLMLRKIQEASNKTNSTDSVRWYTIPTDTAMPKADVTYNTIGFVGTVGTGATFTLYLDDEKTGAKTYHVYFKQLGGTGKLTLTTGKAGATNLILNAGTYVAIIYVDESGNITSQGATATDTIEAGNTQPATSSGVAQAIASSVGTPDVTNATGVLPEAHGGTGQTDLANVAVGSAGKWTTARDIKIQDSDGTNTGSAVSVDGSADKTLKLPSTIKATLSGNATSANYSRQGAYCTTASATQAKVASMTDFAYQSGCAFPITFTNANSYNGKITLNINSTGAKDVWLNGSVSSSSNKTLPAGTYICFCESNVYKLDTGWCVPYARSASSASSASSAGKLTTARKTYVTLGTASTTTTRDWSGDTTIPVSGTLGVANGGTGQTSLANVSVGNADKVDNYHVSTASGTTKNDSLNSLVPVSKQYFTTTSGYIVYANGLKIQWGRKRASSLERYTSFTITNADMLSYASKDSYSISFSFQKDSGNMSFCVGIQGKSASGFQAAAYGLGASDTSIELNWFTIGY